MSIKKSNGDLEALISGLRRTGNEVSNIRYDESIPNTTYVSLTVKHETIEQEKDRKLNCLKDRLLGIRQRNGCNKVTLSLIEAIVELL